MYQQHKLNFFEQIAYAVGRPMQYYRLTKVSGARLTVFVFLFILITSLISNAHMFYNIFGPNGVTSIVRKALPEFELSNGELYVSERYEETVGDTYVLIDTNVASFSESDIDKSYTQVLLVSRSNILFYQLGTIQETKFSDLYGFHFDNNTLETLKPFFVLIMIVVAVFIYLFDVGWYFLTALLYSLIGMIVNSVKNANLTYSTVFKTAIYSKVTICILFTLTDLLPISIPLLVKTGVGLIATSLYVIYGIISHTTMEAYEEAGINPQDNYHQ